MEGKIERLGRGWFGFERPRGWLGRVWLGFERPRSGFGWETDYVQNIESEGDGGK
jgi:hypothetical protein